jgi:hypothetical protein
VSEAFTQTPTRQKVEGFVTKGIRQSCPEAEELHSRYPSLQPQKQEDAHTHHTELPTAHPLTPSAQQALMTVTGISILSTYPILAGGREAKQKLPCSAELGHQHIRRPEQLRAVT